MSFTHEDFDKFLTKSGIFGDISKGHIVRTLNKPAVFKPLPGSPISSWTKNADQASKFARNQFSTGVDFKKTGGGIALVLIAPTTDNQDQFFDIEAFYDGFIKSEFHSEQEVIGLGNIIITKIQWFILD